MTARPWLYFGCSKESGHYLFTPTGSGRAGLGSYEAARHFETWDGRLAPKGGSLYKAAYFQIDGAGYCGLSWWDQSVDKRPGSNSIIFCPKLLVPMDILEEARERFPWVFTRLPQELEMFTQWHST